MDDNTYDARIEAVNFALRLEPVPIKPDDLVAAAKIIEAYLVDKNGGDNG